MVVKRRAWRAPAVTLLASCCSACAGGPPRAPLEVDCSVEDAYDFLIQQPMEGAPMDAVGWFGFGGDATPGAVDSFGLQPIPGGRCGSSSAMLLSSRGHTDWGSGFGESMSNQSPVQAGGYEGVSFWARATGFGTSTGFLLTIQDRDTTMAGGVCTERTAADVAAGGYTTNEGGMIVPAGGALPGPDDCGNGFARPVIAHREWYLHRLPFESFLQTANPNRIRGGVDRSLLYGFSINLPKDSHIELWIDDLGVYRRHDPSAQQTAQDMPESSFNER